MTPVISLVISDVDATLITPGHVVTDRAHEAVRGLRERGILFTIASSRPPRGLRPFVEAMSLSEPFAAFNGGVIQRPGGETLIKRTLTQEICAQALDIANASSLDLWVYCDHEWHVGRRTPFVEREEQTVGFSPIVHQDIRETFGTAAKLVIVGDPQLVAEAEPILIEKASGKVSATRSKPRFLDITTAEAHKGAVVTELSKILKIPAAHIAVIGDGLNDILMFERAGFSIAMGQAAEAVRNAATVVTAPNTDEGFARGIEQYILPAVAS